MERAKMSNANRAKQFLPFDALKGFYKMVNKVTKEKEEKRCLSDDGLDDLLKELNKLKKGDMVDVTYYNEDHYETITGLVSLLDFYHKSIRIVKTNIFIADIYKIYRYDY